MRPPRRVLLVEDYLPLRTLVAEALASEGFEVTSFDSAADALKRFQPDCADVLVTDIDLPERPNGVELATIMRAQDPGLAILPASVYKSRARRNLERQGWKIGPSTGDQISDMSFGHLGRGFLLPNPMYFIP